MTDGITLTAGDTSLVLDCTKGARPGVLYWGKPLPTTSQDLLRRMTTRQHAHGGPDMEVAASLLNEIGSGFSGGPGFAAHRDGKHWASHFVVDTVEQVSAHALTLSCRDQVNQVSAIHSIALDADSTILTIRTRIINEGQEPLVVDTCAAACLPLDPRATRLFGFTGRWADEFQLEEIPPFKGSYVRENRSGRTSHHSFPGLIATSEHTDEQDGLAVGFHLGWSGNAHIRVDRLSDGRSFVQMGECFHPGELRLGAGEAYDTPTLHAAQSDQGRSALSHKFHQHVRDHVLDGRIKTKPRPVHYNTWEAVYFDHDPDTLFALADKAADLGVERFVLDDGWFGGRRSDRAGLGDWWISKDVYPDGLAPLIKHVTSNGMEFGLWFEPEMVNPDSDLFRAHPDWVLQADGMDQVSSRNQLVLDLTRAEVSDHLFGCLDALLCEHDIAYVKWDMNRDIHHPGSFGRAAVSRQTRAVYALIDRVRAAHPKLEIETCSSGGGRADYGILQRTDRIWTSDSNDALDRQRIQRGASTFFPFEIMGAHVGPATCHITGRQLSMPLRVATALFGHMGLELNLLKEDPGDLEILKSGIALYKTHRALLHSGALQRLETPTHVRAMGVVAEDRGEALFSWCNLTSHQDTLPGRIYFSGLDPKAVYQTRIIWPTPIGSRTQPSIIDALQLDAGGTPIPGDALMEMGLQLPLLYPETCILFHLRSA